VFQEVTCANTVLLDPQTAPAEIVRVVDSVIEQRRPGYIEVPYDMPDVPIVPYLAPSRVPTPSDPDALRACIDECSSMINQAKRPVILAGVELHRHGLTDLALALADKHNIPIAATLLSKSVIRETHPLYIGVYSAALSEPACRKYVDNSDCVIMLGTFITDMFLGINTAKLERKTTILATTEKTQVRFHRYDNIRFGEFLESLGKAKIKKRAAFDNPNPAVEPVPLAKNERHDPLTIAEMFRILGLYLDDDSAVVADTGDAVFGAISLRTAKRQEFIAPAYYCTMGFAVPASIGVAVADPSKHVYVIVGDGAFQMTGMELSTAATHNLPLTVIILNNDGYGTQRRILDGPFNEIRRWNYTQVCSVLDAGQADVVETKGQFDGAIRKANSHDGLSVIEVRVDRDDASESLTNLTREMAKLRDPVRKKKTKASAAK
jgi:indolepyruvate decarboxylase